MIEHAPFNVIAAITPVTHSPHADGQRGQHDRRRQYAGRQPHPSGRRVAAEGVRRYNEAIYRDLGIDN